MPCRKWSWRFGRCLGRWPLVRILAHAPIIPDRSCKSHGGHGDQSRERYLRRIGVGGSVFCFLRQPEQSGPNRAARNLAWRRVSRRSDPGRKLRSNIEAAAFCSVSCLPQSLHSGIQRLWASSGRRSKVAPRGRTQAQERPLESDVPAEYTDLLSQKRTLFGETHQGSTDAHINRDSSAGWHSGGDRG